jgi:1-acyl-sn-glycerol-3-phosphate acyltransferase
LIATLLRLVTGVRARFVGFDADTCDGGCRVYFANHTSHLDGPIIWAALPRALRRRTRPMAARDYWSRGPLRRWLALRVFRCVLIERHKVTPSSNPLRGVEAAVDAGDSLILFPEGTRGDGVEIGAFKPGIYHIARARPQLEFVPVYLENLNRILPRGEFLFIPLLSTAYFGPAIRLQEGEPRAAFVARARDAVRRLQAGGG